MQNSSLVAQTHLWAHFCNEMSQRSRVKALTGLLIPDNIGLVWILEFPSTGKRISNLIGRGKRISESGFHITTKIKYSFQSSIPLEFHHPNEGPFIDLRSSSILKPHFFSKS